MSPKAVLVPFKKASHDHQRCVLRALDAAEARCAGRGARLTRLRRRVLELVWSCHEPVKAYDILARLRREHRGAAPPTVYRALEFLLEEGLVHRIESLNAFIGCGDPNAPHAAQFMICRACGAVAEMGDPEITRALARKAKKIGFEIDGQTVEIKGLCPECSMA